MEILSFYWVNILSGYLLVLILGTIGQHLITRNQSMEVMLLGQEFQTGILVAVLLLGFFEDSSDHSEHGLHLETLLSLAFVAVIHGFYSFLVHKFRSFRVEGALVFIMLLMGLGHLVVVISPMVEFHMVKSYLGDIVTVSKFEAIFVTILAVVFGVLLRLRKQNIFLDTLEIGLFNKTTKKRPGSRMFELIVLVLMLFSVHLFGSLFTVGCIIIPAFIAGILRLPRNRYFPLMILNSLMVIVSFGLLLYNDRFPTTVVILFLITLSSLFFAAFFALHNKRL